MKEIPEAKSARLLSIYSRLVNGETIGKKELAGKYHVSERSIQRDIESLRCFFAEELLDQDVIYDFSLLHDWVDCYDKSYLIEEILRIEDTWYFKYRIEEQYDYKRRRHMCFTYIQDETGYGNLQKYHFYRIQHAHTPARSCCH